MIFQVEGFLFVDLKSKYETNGFDLECRDKFAEFKHKIDGFKESHGKFKVGDLIYFYGGFNDDILYLTEILGFGKDGDIYLLWDCYWFPIKDEPIRGIAIKE